MLNEIKAEAQAQGVNLTESDGQNSATKQTADIEAALVQKVNAIVISPLDVNALAPAIEEAVKAGVPVVTIDRRVDGVQGILAHGGPSLGFEPTNQRINSTESGPPRYPRHPGIEPRRCAAISRPGCKTIALC